MTEGNLQIKTQLTPNMIKVKDKCLKIHINPDQQFSLFRWHCATTSNQRRVYPDVGFLTRAERFVNNGGQAYREVCVGTNTTTAAAAVFYQDPE